MTLATLHARFAVLGEQDLDGLRQPAKRCPLDARVSLHQYLVVLGAYLHAQGASLASLTNAWSEVWPANVLACRLTSRGLAQA